MPGNAFRRDFTDGGVHGVRDDEDRDDEDHDDEDHDAEDHASRDRIQHKEPAEGMNRRRRAVAEQKWGHGVALPKQWVRKKPDS